MKFDQCIDDIVAKANRQLGIIVKVFKVKDPNNIVPLYKTFVRLLLEYNSIIWSLYLNKYEDRIESVQKKMLKYLVTLRPLSYKEKLLKVKLLSLRARRILA